MDILDSAIEELQKPQVSNTNSEPNSSYPAPSNGIKTMLNPPESPFLITAGDDKRIRFWNLQNAANSFNVCGLTNDQPKPRYSSHVHESVAVFQEHPNLNQSETTSQANLNISKLRGPSSASINHHESILDVKLMEYPHRMLISGGREGVVKVWK